MDHAVFAGYLISADRDVEAVAGLADEIEVGHGGLDHQEIGALVEVELHFVQGFAAALEVTEPVTSPTFTLVHTYDGRLRVHHLDVYRLERLSELAELAVDELLDDGVVLVEWGDAVADALPAAFLQVDLAFGDEPDQRVAVLSERGARWSSRLRTIEAATDAFAC